MKQIIILLLTVINIGNLNGQILNNEFDNWTTIDTSGQPYQDLLNWYTNNEGLGSGFATTPNIRIEEGNDTGVSLRTAYDGIDGFYSGIITQTINTERLIDISYLSKCDSIFGRGACVVNIYDESEGLLFTDSLKIVESNYAIKKIGISDLPNLESETIKLEFIAFGHTGPLELIQAYSEFKILNVNANYLSNTSSQLINDIVIIPNPFSSIISIVTSVPTSIEYYLFNAHGQLILKGNRTEVDTKNLQKGNYYLQIHKNNQVETKTLIKH